MWAGLEGWLVAQLSRMIPRAQHRRKLCSLYPREPQNLPIWGPMLASEAYPFPTHFTHREWSGVLQEECGGGGHASSPKAVPERWLGMRRG